MANKRIIDQTTDTSLSSGDYVMVDNETEGSKKYDLGSKLNTLDNRVGSIETELTGVSTLIGSGVIDE